MPNIKLSGAVSEDGVLTINNQKRLIHELKKFKGCLIEIEIKKKNRRSNPQNRYYWGVVVKEIQVRLNELGNDFEPETVHEFLKGRFNKKEIAGEGGEVLDHFGGSTTEMNKEEFSVYVDKIIEWAASFLSITIPLPNTGYEISIL